MLLTATQSIHTDPPRDRSERLWTWQGWLAEGNLNHWTGWTLLIVGFAAGGWLDPWSLGEADPAALWETGRMHARHAQAVILGSAFLQLAAARILAEARSPAWEVTLAAAAAAAGSTIYVLGYVAGVFWPGPLWLVPVGAGLNLAAFSTLLVRLELPAQSRWLKVILAVFCFGVLLAGGMGLFAAAPQDWMPNYLGQWDGVQMRMLRLARAAVIALAVLCLFYRELPDEKWFGQPVVRWAGRLMLWGAVGMPLLLVLAATCYLPLKHLLGIPAQLVFVGVLVGCWQALRHRPALEAIGWCLVAVSMAAGLLIGLYAFDGPLPAPDVVGQYNDFNRRLLRLAHAYWILQGVTAMFLTRSYLSHGHPADLTWRLASLLLLLGVAATMLATALATVFSPSVGFLGIGALLSACAVACVRGRWSGETERMAKG